MPRIDPAEQQERTKEILKIIQEAGGIARLNHITKKQTTSSQIHQIHYTLNQCIQQGYLTKEKRTATVEHQWKPSPWNQKLYHWTITPKGQQLLQTSVLQKDQ